MQVKPAPPESHFDLFKMDKLEYLAQTVRPTYTTWWSYAAGMRHALSRVCLHPRGAIWRTTQVATQTDTHAHDDLLFLPAGCNDALLGALAGWETFDQLCSANGSTVR